MDIMKLFALSIGAIFINNFVFARFLGLCPYIGVSRKVSDSFGMGLAVIFVMTLASLVTWIIYEYLLIPFNISFLRTIFFILVIATLVQVVEIFLRKSVPALYRALGIYLPLITTNCAILGVAVLNIDENYNFIETIVNGFASGIGFTLALLFMASVRERIDFVNIPKPFKGFPVAFILAALMALAFFGFQGMRIG